MHDPVAPLAIVRANEGSIDPAIDTDATDLEKYRETRKLEDLTLKPGASPVMFYIRRLPGTFILGQLEGASIGERVMLAIRGGLFRIERPGKEPMRPSKTKKLSDCDTAEPDWINDIKKAFGMNTIYEMAMVILRLSNLSDDDRGPLG